MTEEAKKPVPGWPSWRYGPKGEAAVFESEADVPKGWKDTQPKVKDEPEEQDL